LSSAMSMPATAGGVSDDLRKGLGQLGKDIKSFLESEGRENRLIAVSGFTGPFFPQGIGGPEITKTLSEELKKLKLNLAEKNANRRPDLTILGRYDSVQDTNSKT